MQGTDPILSERTSRYKRNSLILSVAAILAAMISDASIDKAKIFELTLGPHIWWVGAAILIYNLFWLALLSRQDFVAWDKTAKDCGTRNIYGASFTVFRFKISGAFHRENFWAALTCNVAQAGAEQNREYYQTAARFRSAGQYLTFLLFDIGLTVGLAFIAFVIASGKTWSSFAPVSWGLY